MRGSLEPLFLVPFTGQLGYQFNGKSTGELLRRIVRNLSNYLSKAQSEITVFILREESYFAVTNSIRQGHVAYLISILYLYSSF